MGEEAADTPKRESAGGNSTPKQPSQQQGGGAPSKTSREKGNKKKAKRTVRSSQNANAADHGRDLTANGFEMEGPIAAGAFSTVIRARVLSNSMQVAIKSFDAAKCKKSADQAYVRTWSCPVLRLLRLFAQAGVQLEADANREPIPQKYAMGIQVYVKRSDGSESIGYVNNYKASTGTYEIELPTDAYPGAKGSDFFKQCKEDMLRSIDGSDDNEAAKKDTTGDEAAAATSEEQHAATATAAALPEGFGFDMPKGKRMNITSSAMREVVELTQASGVTPGPHPHIANMLAELTLTTATHAVLEYCGGGSLERHLKRLAQVTGVGTMRGQQCGLLRDGGHERGGGRSSRQAGWQRPRAFASIRRRAPGYQARQHPIHGR